MSVHPDSLDFCPGTVLFSSQPAHSLSPFNGGTDASSLDFVSCRPNIDGSSQSRWKHLEQITASCSIMVTSGPHQPDCNTSLLKWPWWDLSLPSPLGCGDLGWFLPPPWGGGCLALLLSTSLRLRSQLIRSPSWPKATWPFSTENHPSFLLPRLHLFFFKRVSFKT